MKYTPREYQSLITNAIVDNKRVGIGALMGSGKTVATLTAIDILKITNPAPVLIVAPLRVAIFTWPDEIKKWDHLKHLSVSIINGTAAQRKIAAEKTADIHTINYENLPWLVDLFGPKWPFHTIIADESTKLKGYRIRQGAQRAKALAKVAFSRAERFVILTGTPCANGLTDLWGQFWFIDRGERLGHTFGAFTSRFFHSVQVGSDSRAVRLVPQKGAQKQMENLIRDVFISVDPRDYFDIKQPIVRDVFVDLPEKARAIYEKLETELAAELACGATVEAFSAASVSMKCLQLANGALYTDGAGAFSEVHAAKIEALNSIVEEAGGAPVLVAYNFKSDLARLLKAFPQGRALDKNPQTLADWNAGRIPVLFAHPASAGHGLNLQDGGNLLVFFGHNWNLEERLQIIERIGPTRQAQAGHERPVFIYNLIARDTVDEAVLKRTDGKISVLDALLSALKPRTIRLHSHPFAHIITSPASNPAPANQT